MDLLPASFILDRMIVIPFGLQTIETVQQLITTRYSIQLSWWQAGRYLKTWGDTSQRLISKAFEQKPEQV